MSKQSLFEQAEELLRQILVRRTAARVRVLAFLLTQQSAVTHHQIEIALNEEEKIDRVTLYRVLNWLTRKDLIHKVASVDRVWCFRANDNNIAHHQHAHFKCKRCAKVVCLDDMPSGETILLPDGYRGLEIELTVKSLCAQCA